MAEQAANTIYLLGEQPDLLCGTILKNLTSKVFDAPSSSTTPRPPMPPMDEALASETNPDETMSSPVKPGLTRSESQTSLKEDQDQAGAFSLAQLVFVVGHVAIKHIVYLELVEREFKRRKDENAKRKCYTSNLDKAEDRYSESSGKASR
jgi:condensin complex subunit 1